MTDIVGGNIVWNLDVNADKFNRGLKEAEGKASSFGKEAEKSGQSGIGLSQALNQGAVAASGFIAAVTGLGVALSSVAGNFEQNRISFEVMTGSADKGRKALAELSNFAVKTPFELPGLLQASKSLLAYGIESKDLIPVLKNLGDIAAGVGMDKLPNLILAFGQVKAATRLTGMELRQFTEAGVPMLELLSKQGGRSIQQLKDDISDGAVSFEMVQKALQSATSKGGKFFQLMEKQSKTFGGTMSNIKDQVTRSLAEIAGIDIQQGGLIREGSLFAMMKQGAEAALAALNRFTPILVKFTQDLMANKTALIALGGAIGGAVVLALGALVVAIWPAILALSAFMAAGAGIAVILSQMGVGMSTLAPLADMFTSSSDRLKGALDNQKKAYEDLKIAQDNLKQSGIYLERAQYNVEVAEKNLTNTTKIFGASSLEAKGAKLQLRDALVALDDSVKKSGESLKKTDDIQKAALETDKEVLRINNEKNVATNSLATTLMNALNPQIQYLGIVINTTLKPALDSLLRAFHDLWVVLEPILIPTLQFLVFVIGTLVIGVLIALVTGLRIVIVEITKWVNVIKFAVENVYGFFKWLYEQVGKTVIPNLVNDVTGWFGKLPGMITNALSGLYNAIVSPFKSAFDEIRKQADKVWESLQKINPFTRHSPSLIDNVKAGVKIIANEYGKLSDLSLPQVSLMGAQSQFDYSAANLSEIPNTSPTTNNVSHAPVININLGTFIGTESEKRQFAKDMQLALDQYYKGRGQS